MIRQDSQSSWALRALRILWTEHPLRYSRFINSRVSSSHKTLSIVWCPVPGFSIAHNRSPSQLYFASLVSSTCRPIVCMQSDSRVAKDSTAIRLHASICDSWNRSLAVSNPVDASASLLIARIVDFSRRSILDLLVPVASSLHSADLVNRCRFWWMPASWLVRRSSSILRSKSSQTRSRSAISGIVSEKPCFRGVRILEVAQKSFPLASSLHDPWTPPRRSAPRVHHSVSQGVTATRPQSVAPLTPRSSFSLPGEPSTGQLFLQGPRRPTLKRRFLLKFGYSQKFMIFLESFNDFIEFIEFLVFFSTCSNLQNDNFYQKCKKLSRNYPMPMTPQKGGPDTLRDTPPVFAAFKAIWSRSNDKFRPIRLLLSELLGPPKIAKNRVNNKRTTFWGFFKSCDFEDSERSCFFRYFNKFHIF